MSSGSSLQTRLQQRGAFRCINAKAVQEFMGHSTITMTFDTYGHLMPGSRDQVRERMDTYLADAAAEAVA